MRNRIHFFLRCTLAAFGCLVLRVSSVCFGFGTVTFTLVNFGGLLVPAAIYGALCYRREFHDVRVVQERIAEMEKRLRDLGGARGA